jgi:hypothetical protein
LEFARPWLAIGDKMNAGGISHSCITAKESADEWGPAREWRANTAGVQFDKIANYEPAWKIERVWSLKHKS